MAAFSSRELDGFRRTLLERRAQLVAEIRTKLAEAKGERIAPDEASSIDGGDGSVLDLASDLDFAMAERVAMELRDLKAAFERLEKGNFGTCTDCAAPVGLARLQAYPTAKRCTPCQTVWEARQHTPHPKLTGCL